MRKILSLLIIPVLLIGCAKVKEAEVPQEQDGLHEVIFHAGWAPETRTVLQEDGSVWWSPEDEIALFNGDGTMYRLKSDSSEPSPKTNFVGKIGAGEGEITYYAIYPYDQARGMYSFNIPSVQYATAGGFSPGQFISFARSTDDNLAFYNVCAGVKFSVAHEGISKIVFKNRSDILTGDMHIQFPDEFPEDPTILCGLDPNDHSLSATSDLLTVYPAEGKYFITGEYYYASIMPLGAVSFVISYFTDKLVATTDIRTRPLTRSKIAKLSEKDKDLTFEVYDDNTYSILARNILPEGIDKNLIQHVEFHTSSDVTTETIVPDSNPYSNSIPVYFALQGTTAHYYTKADRYMMKGPECISFQGWRELKSADLSMFNTSQVDDFALMFDGCVHLESVNLSSFDTSNALSFFSMFDNCKRLKSLDLSSFSSKSIVEGVYDHALSMFNQCYDLTKIDLKNFDLSICNTANAMREVARFSKNCAIRCNSATRAKLSEYDSKLGSNADYITWVLPEEDLPELPPLVDPDLYTSTDFSKDKTVRIVHQATKGNGVDIVLLGNAYSDRMIEDGTYDRDMELAANAILKDEPYASFKDYLNIYTVYAVSEHEHPQETHTVFDASIGKYDPLNGIVPFFDSYEIYKYASIAFPDKDLEDVAMMIIINQAEGEGNSASDGLTWSEHWWDDDEYSDYAGFARSIGLINRRDRSQTETFSQTVSHEFGHVFAKLGDEYVMTSGAILDFEKEYIVNAHAHVGWYSNIDVTSDSHLIKWKQFLEDERYADTGIGIYEGGYTYQFGVWRPTENSIMRYNNGMFNAPSREVIYKRIHKLALGKEWQYDYDAFVEYDQKNIAAEKAALSAPMVLRPPVPEMLGKPFMKIEKSVRPDGKERISVIMN